MSISTREKAARASEVECALPGGGEAGGGVVDGGEDHAAEDGDGALEAGEHREHLHTHTFNNVRANLCLLLPRTKCY